MGWKFKVGPNSGECWRVFPGGRERFSNIASLSTLRKNRLRLGVGSIIRFALQIIGSNGPLVVFQGENNGVDRIG